MDRRVRIGVLTFHKAYNYGAFLQCYSLTNYLKNSFPNADIEVIDYESSNMADYYNSGVLKSIIGNKFINGNHPYLMILKRAGKTILSVKQLKEKSQKKNEKYAAFQSVWRVLPLSEDSLVSDNLDEFTSFVQKKYDVIIVGSDAVWNDNQTCWPNVFLLHDISGCKKYSCAASTYGMDYLKKPANQIQYAAESFKSFDLITVRDDASAAYVDYCTGGSVRALRICDPSLVIDLQVLPVDRNALREKLVKMGVDLSRPIVGLMCGSWLASEVRQRLGDTFQYVSVYEFNGVEDVHLSDLNPFEWAIVFSFFDVTFTHFFHGTMFSLLNGTMTFSIEQKTNYSKQYVTKIEDALTKMGLTEACYRVIDEMNDDSWAEVKKRILNCNKVHTAEEYANAIQKERSTFEVFASAISEGMRDGKQSKRRK